MGLLDDAMNDEVVRRAAAAQRERVAEAAERQELALYTDEVLSLVEDFLTRLSGFGTPNPWWNWVAIDQVLEFNDPPGEVNPLTGKPFRLNMGVGVVVPHRISEPFIYVSAGAHNSGNTRRVKKPKAVAQAEDARWRELIRTNSGPRLAILLGQVDGYSTKYWLSVDYRLRGDDVREQILKVRRKGLDGRGQRPSWLTPQELAERMVAYLGLLKELLAT